MFCICLVPSLFMIHTPCILDSNIFAVHSWLPIPSSILSCFPSYFIPLFFKLLFLCRLPFLPLPGPPSARSHLFKWNPSIPPYQFLTVGAGNLLRVAFMGGLILLQIRNALYNSAPNLLSLLPAVSFHLRLDLRCMPANWHLQLEPSNRKPEIGTWSIFRLSLQKKD